MNETEEPNAEANEIARLRAELEAVRAERDSYRSDVERARTTHVVQSTTELQLLSAKLNKEIKDDFYTSVSRMVWVAAVLIGVATFGGYLRLDDIIDDKIDDRVSQKRAQIAALEGEIESSLVGFKRKADDALRDLGERSEAVRTASETAISQIKTRSLAVSVESSGGQTTVTTAAWDPWFGNVPERFVGIAGSRHDQFGYETNTEPPAGAFSHEFRNALTAGGADRSGDGLISWVEAVSHAATRLRPKYSQDPVIVGAAQNTIAFAVQPGQSGQKGRVRVLLIGINDYGGPGNLRGPLTDVKEFDALFKSRPFASTATTDVKSLTDRSATAAAVTTAIAELSAAATEDDVVIVFFSGHVSRIKDAAGGSPTGQVKVLVPRDAASDGVSNLSENRLMRVPDVVRTMSKSKAKVSVLIIDG